MQDMVETLDHDDLLELTPEEHEFRVKLENIYGMLTSYKHPRTTREVRNIVMRWKDVSVHQAYRMVRQAQELFGEVDTTQKQVMRVMQTEILKQAIKEVMADPNIESGFERHKLILDINKEIDKINHLEDKDVLDLNQLREMLQLPDTEFTTDPDALNDTIDAEHEEVE